MNEFMLRENDDILEKEKNMYKLLKDIHKYKEYAWKKSENARKGTYTRYTGGQSND